MLITSPTTQFTECKVYFLISSSHNIKFLLLLLSLHLMFTCRYAFRDYLFIFRLFAYSAFHVVDYTPLARLLTRISSLAASQICAYDERSKKKHFAKTGQSKCHVQMCLYLDRVEVVPHIHTHKYTQHAPALLNYIR